MAHAGVSLVLLVFASIVNTRPRAPADVVDFFFLSLSFKGAEEEENGEVITMLKNPEPALRNGADVAKMKDK